MKKYKLVNGKDYSHFIEGESYNEEVILGTRGVPVKELVKEYPNDWEEVTEELINTPKIFTDAEVVTLVTFLNDNFEEFDVFIQAFTWDGGLDLDFYIDLDGDEKYKASLLIDKIEKNDINLTEAEKVTIITFLNDNFEDFKKSLLSDITVETWRELDGGAFNEASLLIDKIELS